MILHAAGGKFKAQSLDDGGVALRSGQEVPSLREAFLGSRTSELYLPKGCGLAVSQTSVPHSNGLKWSRRYGTPIMRLSVRVADGQKNSGLAANPFC